MATEFIDVENIPSRELGFFLQIPEPTILSDQLIGSLRKIYQGKLVPATEVIRTWRKWSAEIPDQTVDLILNKKLRVESDVNGDLKFYEIKSSEVPSLRRRKLIFW